MTNAGIDIDTPEDLLQLEAALADDESKPA